MSQEGQKFCCNDSSIVDEQTTPREGETLVLTVDSLPSDGMGSLQETTASASGFHQATTHTYRGRIATSDVNEMPIDSLIEQSALQRHPSPPTPPRSLPFPSQVTDSDCDDTDDKYDIWRYSGVQLRDPFHDWCALLIGGRDSTDSDFTQVCMNDVACMQKVLVALGVSHRNIYQVTPSENTTERQITDICGDITMKKPRGTIVYFSGHHPRRGTDQPRLYVSDEQGSALDVASLRKFIDGLLPSCTDLTVILDCCSAGDIILLPTLQNGQMPNRRHIQLFSCRANGESKLNHKHSIFTSYIISALQLPRSCPNLAKNCPICRTSKPIDRDGGINWLGLWDDVYQHVGDRFSMFSYKNQPFRMFNP